MHREFSFLNDEAVKLIDLTRAKKYLSIEHKHDDEMIAEMIDMAVIAAENYIGLSLNKRNWKMTVYFDVPNIIKLKHEPINKVISFKLFTYNDKELSLKEDDYILDKMNDQIIINKHYSVKKAEIIYEVGYIKLPTPISQGILEHLAKLYDFRGSDSSLPVSAKSLYQPYKRVRL